MNELTTQQIKKYKIDRASLIKGSKDSMYVNDEIIISIIMQTRLSYLKTIKFRSDFSFDQINLILKKEQLLIIPLLKAFSAEKIKYSTKSSKLKE